MFDQFFDPEKLLTAIEKIKDAMRTAADADTGAAKPLFEEMYRDFADKLDNPAAEENQQDMVKGFMKSINLSTKLAAEAKNNPAAAATMQQLQKDISAAISDIIDIKSIFNKFSGGGFDLGKFGEKFEGFGSKSKDADASSDDLPSPRKNDKKGGPKKPNGDDFKI